MAEYRIRSTGEIVTNLAIAFPNCSIPQSLTQEDFDSLGADPIFEGPQPLINHFQFIQRTGPIQDSKGNWVWEYIAVDHNQEFIDAAMIEKWKTVRTERDRLLSASDWTQLPDVSLSTEKKAEWTAYRQALRDITNQTDPFSISWPTDPNFIPKPEL